MRTQTLHTGSEWTGKSAGESRLDLVVPFTTSPLTQVALDAANRMGAGLNASIRLVKVQVVPFPMDLCQSPVALDFIREQLRHFRSELPVRAEIRLARDMSDGLKGTLTPATVVVLGFRKRPWITTPERLAVSLRRAGHHVVLVQQPQGDAAAAPDLESMKRNTHA